MLSWKQKSAGLSHCFRWAKDGETGSQNYLGKWVYGELIGFETGWPSVAMRDAGLVGWNHKNEGKATPKLVGMAFSDGLRAAAEKASSAILAEGFDPTYGN